MLTKNLQEHFILATDLDGTFLETVNPEQDVLYRFIRRNRKKIQLIFVTGRGLESVLPLLSEKQIPRPDYIIADVGATFFDVRNQTYIHDLQMEFDQIWPGYHNIQNILSEFKNLTIQKVPQERRCSYFFDSNTPLEKISAKIKLYNCNILESAGKYLDILPKGANKGQSLLKLLNHYQMNTENVLVAGDTLNDLSLFQTGLKGVVVGGAEKALIQKTKDYPKTIISHKRGTNGIVEALERLGLAQVSTKCNLSSSSEFGSSELVIAYHRQPFDEIKKGKSTERSLPKSPNGIIPTLLGFFADGTHGSWVAWSQQTSRNPSEFETYVDVSKDNYPNLKCARVPLNSEDISIFYKKFSKEAFWPIIFSFPNKFKVNHEHWNLFKEINILFAKQAALEAKKGALVWIHDYNLWLVPGFLRNLRPDLKISFFHHTAFPSADIFNLLPWKHEIIMSLTQCDHIGFHIPRYVENFMDVLRSNFPVQTLEMEYSAPRYMTYGCALGVDKYTSKIKVNSREIHLGSHPVGVDNSRIQNICKRPDTKEQIKKLRQETGNRKIILSVERLDYVKGPIEKIEAYEEFLEKNPELHDRVVFINIVTPPAPGMDVYKITREKLDQIIGRVNGRFAKLNWTPIRYFYRSLPFEDLIPFYAASDIAWITPLRDGLNLVCKEFLSAKFHTQSEGSLILSEFAGASVELHGAILVNPFDKTDMVQSLIKAIKMDDTEISLRMKQMLTNVQVYDVKRWADDYLRILK